MISDLYTAVAKGLKKVEEAKVYFESVEQGFSTPSFLIQVIDVTAVNGINKRLLNSVDFDVAYFPRDEDHANAECLAVGENLRDNFRLDGYRHRNRNYRVTDKVLHFLFSVDCREYMEISTPCMESLNQRTDLKGD